MLSLVKHFIRVDEGYTHEDELIEHLISTAKDYIKNATGYEFDEQDSIHKQIVLLLTTNWYENRNVAVSQDLDRTIISMLLQAGLTGDSNGN